MNTQFKLTREEAESAIIMDVQALENAISGLWALRLNKDYADLVVPFEGHLWASLGVLKELVSDIKQEQDAAAIAAE